MLVNRVLQSAVTDVLQFVTDSVSPCRSGDRGSMTECDPVAFLLFTQHESLIITYSPMSLIVLTSLFLLMHYFCCVFFFVVVVLKMTLIVVDWIVFAGTQSVMFCIFFPSPLDTGVIKLSS